jgi:hypothetical protein
MACTVSAYDSSCPGLVSLSAFLMLSLDSAVATTSCMQEALGASERVISYLDAPAAPQIASGKPLPAFSGQVPIASLSGSAEATKTPRLLGFQSVYGDSVLATAGGVQGCELPVPHAAGGA